MFVLSVAGPRVAVAVTECPLSVDYMEIVLIYCIVLTE